MDEKGRMKGLNGRICPVLGLSFARCGQLLHPQRHWPNWERPRDPPQCMEPSRARRESGRFAVQDPALSVHRAVAVALPTPASPRIP